MSESEIIISMIMCMIYMKFAVDCHGDFNGFLLRKLGFWSFRDFHPCDKYELPVDRSTHGNVPSKQSELCAVHSVSYHEVNICFV